MRRLTLVGALALLVTFPLAEAVQSCLAALASTGGTSWLMALADVVTASVALFCCIAVLVLLGEDRTRRMPRIPLYDWRMMLGRRRVKLSNRTALSRSYEYWTNG